MTETEWTGFPSTRDDQTWPGAWKWGVNFASETQSMRVLAVRLGGGDIKYGTDWMGPIALTVETAAMLERWAESALSLSGGYVHLFPADGDGGDAELREWAADQDDAGEDDEE